VARRSSDRRYPGEVASPGLAMIGGVESGSERAGATSRERRDGRGSARRDAAARAARRHRGIENRRHRILDAAFRDDLARLRTGHAPAGVAVARHRAVDLPGRAAPPVSLESRRERAGRNTADLGSLVRQTA
jgi:hypothetical protein